MWILNLIVWNIYYHRLFKCIISVHVSFTLGDTASRKDVAVAKHNLTVWARHEKCGKSQNKCMKWIFSTHFGIHFSSVVFWEIRCFTAGGAGLHICWTSLILLKGFVASYIIILFCVHVYSEVGFPAQKDLALHDCMNIVHVTTANVQVFYFSPCFNVNANWTMLAYLLNIDGC